MICIHYLSSIIVHVHAYDYGSRRGYCHLALYSCYLFNLHPPHIFPSHLCHSFDERFHWLPHEIDLPATVKKNIKFNDVAVDMIKSFPMISHLLYCFWLRQQIHQWSHKESAPQGWLSTRVREERETGRERGERERGRKRERDLERGKGRRRDF